MYQISEVLFRNEDNSPLLGYIENFSLYTCFGNSFLAHKNTWLFSVRFQGLTFEPWYRPPVYPSITCLAYL